MRPHAVLAPITLIKMFFASIPPLITLVVANVKLCVTMRSANNSKMLPL